jgi:hypothetical protein
MEFRGGYSFVCIVGKQVLCNMQVRLNVSCHMLYYFIEILLF